MQTKSVIVANDIVGLGKVALTSSLPVLSACQIEVSPLPTVLLSSHTGGFQNIMIKDLTEEMKGFFRQWQSLSLAHDGILTGYFRSKEQLKLIASYAAERNLACVVDPVMGDQGRLYAGFDGDFVDEMKNFCQGAELILPNLTEAALLTDTAFLVDGYSQADIVELLHKLASFGVKHVIITGVSFEPDKIGLAYLDSSTGETYFPMSKSYAHHFFGTGDLLTAVLSAGYLHGFALEKIAELALDFIDASLKTTLELKRDLKFGLCYEPHLGTLIEKWKGLMEE